MDVTKLLEHNLEEIKAQLSSLKEETIIDLLDKSLSKGKNDIAAHLLEIGVRPKNPFNLNDVASKRNNLKMLKLLDSHGVDLNRGNYIMFFQAALSRKQDNFDYLYEKVPAQHRVIELVMINIVNKIHLDSFVPIRKLEEKKQKTPVTITEVLEKTFAPFEYIFKKCLQKSTQEQRNNCLKDNFHPEFKVMLNNIFLNHTLEKNATQVANTKKRTKI